MCGAGMQHLEYIEAGDHIYTNGCIDKLVNWIHSNMFLLGGVALGLAIPQVGYGAQDQHSHVNTNTRALCSAGEASVCVFFFLSLLQLVGILLSQILINQIKDQIALQNYNLKHRSDPWS